MKNTTPTTENSDSAAPLPLALPSASGDLALTPHAVLQQVALIQQIMGAAMKDGEHFGRIPGCGDRPTLLKPGAEKLCFTFRLSTTYDVFQADFAGGHREYRITCNLTSIVTGRPMGEGIGICSTLESKYRFKKGEGEATDSPVPRVYWDLRADDPAKAQQLIGGKGYSVKKVDGKGWMIAKGGEKTEHDNPADNYNTVLKMAKKRALVDAVLTATAASDIFTQDLESIVENQAVYAEKVETQDERRKRLKLEWQRENRRQFQRENGYSTATNYGGIRADVLQRDGNACVSCGMTESEHQEKWGRPITLDHKNGNRRENTMENLQTLCLECHGKKDGNRQSAKGPSNKEAIMDRRAAGETYEQISDAVGMSIGAIHKWVQRWSAGDDLPPNEPPAAPPSAAPVPLPRPATAPARPAAISAPEGQDSGSDSEGLKSAANMDFRETRVHFGKNRGLMLSELSPQQVHWYENDWMPKKELNGPTCPEDLTLIQALKDYRDWRGNHRGPGSSPAPAPIRPATPPAAPVAAAAIPESEDAVELAFEPAGVDPSAPAAWRNVQVHHGANAGKKLCTLSKHQREYYTRDWMPKNIASGISTREDKNLIQGLQEADRCFVLLNAIGVKCDGKGIPEKTILQHVRQEGGITLQTFEEFSESALRMILTGFDAIAVEIVMAGC